MPRVSVILPVYNPAPEELERALASVLGQTVDDLEVVVVDDGSVQSQSWVAEIDSRVVYVRQSNRGVSIARNVGVQRATAELIALIDQDDAWMPEKIERQLELVDAEGDAAFWCTGFVWVRESEEVPSIDGRAPNYHDLLSDGMVLNSSVMMRKSDYRAVGGCQPLLTQTQDWDLFLRLSMEGRQPAMAVEPLVRCYLHDHNASRDYWSAATERMNILGLHERRARRRGDRATMRAVGAGKRRTHELFAYQAIDATRAAWRERELGHALRHLRRAAKLSPVVAVRSIGQAVTTRVPRRRVEGA